MLCKAEQYLETRLYYHSQKSTRTINVQDLLNLIIKYNAEAAIMNKHEEESI